MDSASPPGRWHAGVGFAAPPPASQGSPKAAWSLQQRLRRQLLLLLCGLWLAGSVAAVATLWSEATLILDSALAETAERLSDLPEPALDAASTVSRNVAAYPATEFIVYQVFDRNGQLRLRSHSAPVEPLDNHADDGVRDVGGWRVLTLNDSDSGRRVRVAESLAHRRAIVLGSIGWLAATLAGVLALAAWAMRAVLKSGFDSLGRPRAELLRRAADDLRPLSPQHALPTELQPWLEAVDSLMLRLRGLLEAERWFAGHAAHELRTPLAAARALAQRIAETAPREGPAGEHAQRLIRQLDRLTRLTTGVLQLARLESGVALQREPVDLAALVDWVAGEFTDARQRGLLVVEPPLAAQAVAGDLDAIGLAFRNLVDNALKHGGSPVRLRAEGRALVVRDLGRGIAAGDVERLRRPFVRGGATAADGAGLGLSIVERVAARSQARLVLLSPAPGQAQGLEARLEFDTDAHKLGQSEFGTAAGGSAPVHRAN